MTYYPLVYRLLISVLAVGAAFVSARAAMSPDGYLLKLLFLLVAASLAVFLSPHALIAVSVFVFAISTAFSAPVLASLPVEIYISDLMVVLLALRGALPRPRVPPNRALAGAPTILFVLWAAIMAIAAVRAIHAGIPFASAIRGDLALFYWPLLYFGFTRVLRERQFNVSRLWTNLAVVAVGLAAYMFLARALNQPFGGTGLADVPTGEETAVRRDFGVAAAAFVVYPALALVGIAGMAFGQGNRLRWFFLALVGAVATLMTLVRGEIIGLALGTLVILWLRPRRMFGSSRARTAVQIAFAVAAFAGVLLVANPTLGNAIIQRTLPFIHQAEDARLNAEYREEAVATGFRIARENPLGLGVLDTTRLHAENIDPGFLAHSGVATLLVFGGWPAFASALLVILALFRRSSLVAARNPWLHPAMVGVLTMLSLYTFSAAALAGDGWVIPLGALAVALRFAIPPAAEQTHAMHGQLHASVANEPKMLPHPAGAGGVPPL